MWVMVNSGAHSLTGTFSTLHIKLSQKLIPGSIFPKTPCLLVTSRGVTRLTPPQRVRLPLWFPLRVSRLIQFPNIILWGLSREHIVRFTLQTRFPWLNVLLRSSPPRQVLSLLLLLALRRPLWTPRTTRTITRPVLLRCGFPREYRVVVTVEQALALDEAIMWAAKAEPPLLLRLVRSSNVILSMWVLSLAHPTLGCSTCKKPLVAESLGLGWRTHTSLLPLQRPQVRQSHMVSTGKTLVSRTSRCSIPETLRLLVPGLQDVSASMSWVTEPTTLRSGVPTTILWAKPAGTAWYLFSMW